MTSSFSLRPISRESSSSETRSSSGSRGFLDLSGYYTKAIEKRLRNLDQALESLSGEYGEMRKSLNGIELISQIGAVEASRLNHSKHDFGHYIARMREFATLLRGSIQELGSATGGLGESLAFIMGALKQASPCTPEIFSLAFSFRKKG